MCTNDLVQENTSTTITVNILSENVRILENSKNERLHCIYTQNYS